MKLQHKFRAVIDRLRGRMYYPENGFIYDPKDIDRYNLNQDKLKAAHEAMAVVDEMLQSHPSNNWRTILDVRKNRGQA